MSETDGDSISSRISPGCPPSTQQILTAAWAHDVPAVKKLLDEPGRASSQDPVTGETPLHATIRACGPPSQDDTAEDLENAKAVAQELFLWGAIWNDVDDRNETPGCLALRLNRPELYNLCVEAGVRAELLFALMGGYEELSSGEEEEEDAVEAKEVDDNNANGAAEDGDEAPKLVAVEANGESGEAKEQEEEPKFVRPSVNSADYLRSSVTYSEGKLVDDDGNGVMMAWETDIMRKSVDALLPGRTPGKRILNVGFGMGIIDGLFAETKPSRHHIIEAHPEVLAYISTPESKFDTAWEASGGESGAFKVHQGKWQDICPNLLEEGQVYDAIYFDTFGEDYSQMRMFFTEYVPGLLDQDGIFGFFNGLGADRQICYDVYTKVVEIHLADGGLDVDWNEIGVDMNNLAEDGKGDWKGVKMRYWTLDSKFCTSLLIHQLLARSLINLSRISVTNLYLSGVNERLPRPPPPFFLIS